MAQNPRIAKRYAGALFGLADDNSVIDAVQADLKGLAQLLSTSEGFSSFVANPLLTAEQHEAVFGSICGNADGLTKKFLTFLVEKGRLDQLAGICERFEALCFERNGLLKVGVTMAHEPTAAQKSALIEKLHAKFGKTIEAAFAVNEDLVGGFRLKIENEILDYSVATQLETFKKQVLNA